MINAVLVKIELYVDQDYLNQDNVLEPLTPFLSLCALSNWYVPQVKKLLSQFTCGGRIQIIWLLGEAKTIITFIEKVRSTKIVNQWFDSGVIFFEGTQK